jgi:DNA-binding MarR family transcriptional regulator
MPVALKHTEALSLLHDLSLAIIRKGGPDLSSRQLCILLTIYMEAPPHTVRGLAAKLRVTKPVITRALDSMGDLDLVSRRRDDADKRNVIIQRTVKGALFLDDLSETMVAQARQLPNVAAV